ncbi:hypothetical protein [Cellulomonas marina]|uniref:Uncharacterized protein n=1 Tax=Cellulomonas marina TaxID=988821 RepID=A0A1I1AH96_9CELL|nr:hypothetical protein [Cellulomonas marina]GIG29728.1 hypothetical protein Cma02nite_23280 [Cellulomonas marina]SFB35858.1 hypothetical protein SAMN05421867_11726 [Cellulomonas marina]
MPRRRQDARTAAEADAAKHRADEHDADGHDATGHDAAEQDAAEQDATEQDAAEQDGEPDAVAHAAADLYVAPPEEFVRRRDAAARLARSTGDREAAAGIAALRRPTVSAWLVNLLMVDSPLLAGQVRDLGTGLREAAAHLDGPGLRDLDRQRRQLVAALVQRARDVARAEGHRITDAVALEVETTLSAALTDPSVAAEVTSGRLTGPRTHVGFGLPDEAGTSPPPSAPPARVPTASDGRRRRAAEQDAERTRRRERAEAAREAARTALATAREAADVAVRQADDARRAQDEADRHAADARDAEAALEERLADLERQLDAQRRTTQAAAAAARSAAEAAAATRTDRERTAEEVEDAERLLAEAEAEVQRESRT